MSACTEMYWEVGKMPFQYLFTATEYCRKTGIPVEKIKAKFTRRVT